MTGPAELLEPALLVLVVVHAVRHLPDEMHHSWQRMQRYRKPKNGPWHWLMEMGLMIVMGLAGLISAAPFLYYSLECAMRLSRPMVA